MRIKYVAPAFKSKGFNCPFCGTYAHQEWRLVKSGQGASFAEIEWLSASRCSRCSRMALWVSDKMLFPVSSVAPLPEEEMPEDVKNDFNEARNVVNASPRAATALLRLALQKLMVHLGEKGKNLNDDIANLVKRGLPEKMQKALDSVRVIGNNAVHPGEIDLRDDSQTAISLFDLVNMIIEVMITQPKKVEEIYGKIPDSTKKAITERDKKA